MKEMHRPRRVDLQPVRCCGIAREVQTQALQDPRDPVLDVRPDPPPPNLRLSVSEVLDRLLIDRGAAMVSEVEQWMERWK